MSEPLFVKKSDKRYIVEIAGEKKELFIPMAKASLLLEAFLESGAVNEDMTVNEYRLVGSFERIAGIVLNVHDKKGNITEAGDCSELSYNDTVKLVSVGLDAFTLFMSALSTLNPTQENKAMEKEKGKKVKTKE